MIDGLVGLFFRRRSPVLDAAGLERAGERLRSELAALPELPEPKSEAAREWRSNRLTLRHAGLVADPRLFLGWPVIKHTMFVGDEQYVAVELNQLKTSEGWERRWRRALVEDAIGGPPALPRLSARQRQPYPPRLPSAPVRTRHGRVHRPV